METRSEIGSADSLSLRQELTLEDEILIERLVDDELDEEERAFLFMRLEQIPDGWRQCACSFLEAQTIRSALRHSFKEQKTFQESLPHELTSDFLIPKTKKRSDSERFRIRRFGLKSYIALTAALVFVGCVTFSRFLITRPGETLERTSITANRVPLKEPEQVDSFLDIDNGFVNTDDENRLERFDKDGSAGTNILTKRNNKTQDVGDSLALKDDVAQNFSSTNSDMIRQNDVNSGLDAFGEVIGNDELHISEADETLLALGSENSVALHEAEDLDLQILEGSVPADGGTAKPAPNGEDLHKLLAERRSKKMGAMMGGAPSGIEGGMGGMGMRGVHSGFFTDSDNPGGMGGGMGGVAATTLGSMNAPRKFIEARAEPPQSPEAKMLKNSPIRNVILNCPEYGLSNVKASCVESDSLDTNVLRDSHLTELPVELLEQLRQDGAKVTAHRNEYRFSLDDGRVLILPVDSYDIEYNSERPVW